MQNSDQSDIKSNSVDLYMDEHIIPNRLNHPQFHVYSCQFNAYKVGEIDLNKDSILNLKKSLSNFLSVTSPVADVFTYHVDATWNGPMNVLSKNVSRKLDEMNGILENHGYGINKIYACNKIGDNLRRYIQRHASSQKKSDISRKIITVCSSKRSDAEMSVHYHVKEFMGDVAKRRATEVRDYLNYILNESKVMIDRNNKKRMRGMLVQIAEDENGMKKYEYLNVDIPMLYKEAEAPLIRIKPQQTE